MTFRGGLNGDGNRKIGRTRLDFFPISLECIKWVDKVRYEDRLGTDFDHKEVTLKLGKNKSMCRRTIFESNLNDELIKHVGTMAVYDSIAHNMINKDERL